jgi:hypothetical protein
MLCTCTRTGFDLGEIPRLEHGISRSIGVGVDCCSSGVSVIGTAARPVVGDHGVEELRPEALDETSKRRCAGAYDSDVEFDS